MQKLPPIRIVLLIAFLGLWTVSSVSADTSLSWQQVTSNAGFHVRDSAGEFVFNNKMWIMGGWYDSFTTNELRDVWSSADGVNWMQVTAQAAWTHPQHPVSLVFNNKMWIMGGYQGGRLTTADQTNEVWWSDDGASWTKAIDAPWGARFAAGGAVFNNKMWIFGGTRNTPGAGSNPTATAFDDVWNSTNGVNWSRAVQHAPWSARGYEQVLVFNDKLWLLGGGNYKTPTATFVTNNDVWSSDDGVNWTLATEHAAWTPRIWHNAIVYQNEMWILGGADSSSRALDDVWHSSDGVNWTQATNEDLFSPPHEASLYDFQGKLWVVAGATTVTTNGVWQTSITPGDYNGDGFVDGADYVLWRKDPASYGGPDGYTAWRGNFGAVPGAGSALGSTAIPEPGTLALVVLGVLTLGASCHHQMRPDRGDVPLLAPLRLPVT